MNRTRKSRFSVAITVCAWLLCQWQLSFAQQSPAIQVSPQNAPIDENVSIRVTGVAPGEVFSVRAITIANGGRWSSEATFNADSKGSIDLTRLAPRSGSYQGVDGNGLLWSMRPENLQAQPEDSIGLRPPDSTPFIRPVSGKSETEFELVGSGKLLAKTTLIRDFVRPEVKIKDVRENGLVGRFYEPAGKGHSAAVLVLQGSRGGIPAQYAPVLASHGYAVLALAYFRVEGLPKDLVEIPLEYFLKAIDWMKAQPSVDGKRIGVLGLSKGGELSLLLAANYPERFRAVVALSPSSVVWEGAVRDPEKTGVAALKPGRSSWTIEGKPLPYMPKTITPEIRARLDRHEPFNAIEMMLPGPTDASAMKQARIPVEKIRAPILLISSQADRNWPSGIFSEQVVATLKENRFAYAYEHLSYPQCSHFMPDSWTPPLYGGGVGGTADGTMHAYADYWPKLLTFLEKNLGE
jgi:dienelactone hydrolase